MSSSKYQKVLARIYELQKFGIKLGLSSTERLLAKLGSPQNALTCVHLAGTNGKGSVGAMLEAAALAGGLKTGFFSSPHLVSFTERFRLNGRQIAPRKVISLAEQVWTAVEPSQPPTFFEFVTAMSFLYFVQERVDLAIMETGMGGRLDATNICHPLVSVITNIGLEHQEYLGRTLSAIAGEKAGIIKPRIPVVHGVSQPSARLVLEKKAVELAAPILRRGRDMLVRSHRQGFSLQGRLWSLPGLSTNLVGRHQPGNASLAMGAAEILAQSGLPLTMEHFRDGLKNVDWPGRLEKVADQENGPTIWMDGAHNPPAAQVLVDSLDLVRQNRSPLVMVLGVMADKDVEKVLNILVPAADKVIFSRPKYQRAASPRILAQIAPRGCTVKTEDDLVKAIDQAKTWAGPHGVVLITGSLYLVGEAKAILAGVECDLP